MLLEEAYERAGYAPDRGHASRLAAREDVRARIFEIRLSHTDVETAEHPRVIESLISLAHQSRALRTPEGVKEARLALLDAARLQVELAKARMRDRKHMVRDLKAGRSREPGTPEEVQENTQASAPGPRRVA